MTEDTGKLIERIEALEHRLAITEDREAIRRLQYIYGYYLDNRMWDEIAGLFADEGASIEIGRRGAYYGKDRIRVFLNEVLGQGRWGLEKNEFVNHVQMQMVIDVDENRNHARVRSRAIVQGNSPPQPGNRTMLWAEGIYENTYVRENGVWKIERLWWEPTFYVHVPGFDTALFQSAPQSDNYPPDRSTDPEDRSLGRRFPPFHYLHPITGEEPVTPPTSDRMKKHNG